MFQELTNLLVAHPVLHVLIILLVMIIIFYLNLKRDSIPKKIWLPLSIMSGLVFGFAMIALLKLIKP